MHQPPLPRADTDADHIIERAVRLWAQPLPDSDALVAFRAVYADPVAVNGQPVSLEELVTRARALQQAITAIHHRIDARVVEANRLALAFTLSGRHTGTLTTPLGEITATHRDVAVTGIDIFDLDPDTGHVRAVWATADWIGLIAQTTGATDHAAAPPPPIEDHTTNRKDTPWTATSPRS